MTYIFFFFNDTATTEIYTLSLHDALPIWSGVCRRAGQSAAASPRRYRATRAVAWRRASRSRPASSARSEEHTSELQSRQYLVCRLLLEKKKKKHNKECNNITTHHDITLSA